MKKRYRREAYYLDDGVLLHGYRDKRGFHPDPIIQCGFGAQVLNKRSIGKELFFSLEGALKKLGQVELAGGKFIAAIDFGLARTKVLVSAERGKLEKCYECDTVQQNEDVSEMRVRKILKESFYSFGVENMSDVTVVYKVAYPFPSIEGEILVNTFNE